MSSHLNVSGGGGVCVYIKAASINTIIKNTSKAKMKMKWSCCCERQSIHDQCICISTHDTIHTFYLKM